MAVDSVVWVKFWLESYDRQTQGFSRPFSDLPELTLVGSEFLRALPHMFRAIHPKQHPKLRMAILYLTALRENQIESWGKTYIQKTR